MKKMPLEGVRVLDISSSVFRRSASKLRSVSWRSRVGCFSSFAIGAP